MTYPKKFFWIYLTTITFFLVGLQQVQSLRSTKNVRTYKVIKKSCVKADAHTNFTYQQNVVAPIPLSDNKVKHHNLYYSIYSNNGKYRQYNNVIQTNIKVGKDGKVITYRILENRSHCKKRKRRKKRRRHNFNELQTIKSQKFIPGTINGEQAEIWMNIDFRK